MILRRESGRYGHDRLDSGHGWDVARATGQSYEVGPVSAQACLAQVSQVAAEGPVEGLFAAAVPIAGDAPVLDRIGAVRTSPSWSA